jgi:ABC-type uncharacterized transport system ATPase subunit
VGEIHGILGQNGASKTTRTRILVREIKPDKGEIYIGGEKVDFDVDLDAQF